MAKDEFNAFLGAGTIYEGQLQFQGAVRIDGQFKGEIRSEGTLILGKDARVEGTIAVNQLILSGYISGEILVAGRTIMHKTAHLLGNLHTPTLAMEEGAILQGKVTMSQSRELAPEAAPE